MRSGIVITHDTLTPNLLQFYPKLHAAIQLTMEYMADRAEGYAKSNAPWQDQTGNARQGLGAKAFSETSSFTLVVFHTMPYGVWLEIRHNGRYAIILPTLSRIGPELMATLNTVMRKMA